MTGSVETFQLSVEAAEVYEARFVPAIFGEWAPHLVEAAGVAPGQAVLDVACGTGVVARTAADRMGGQGRVVGLDLNEGMLAVAGRLRPEIEWRQGDAADAAVRGRLLRRRPLPVGPDVLPRPGRGAARDGPGGHPRRHRRRPGVGPPRGPGGLRRDLRGVRRSTSAPRRWSWRAPTGSWATSTWWARCSRPPACGSPATRTRAGTVRYDSAEEAVATEVEATPLAERIGPEAYRRMLEAAGEALRPFTVAGGRIELPIRGHLITAAKAT